MKNTWKRIGAFALVIMMFAGLAVNAFAEEPAQITDAEQITESLSDSTMVRIEKELIAYNPEVIQINAPSITYSYSIGAGGAGANIQDASGIKVQTYSGVGSPVITESITWSPNDTLQASPEGEKNIKHIEIDFSNVSFERAGVYRYEITENVDYSGTGVTNGTITNVRYLDVYVKDDGIYGYILMAEQGDVSTSTAKTRGFVAAGEDSADSYYTFNVTVSKKVENDQYIKSTFHKFPFSVTFTNSEVTAPVLPTFTISGHADQNLLTAANINDIHPAPAIADSASVTYNGLPAGTAVEIVETNNVTGTTYGVSTVGADVNVQGEEDYQMVFSGNSSNAAMVDAQDAGTANENRTVAFTNSMLVISPTGVVLRIAPYALMLCAGLILLVVSKKRRLARDV